MKKNSDKKLVYLQDLAVPCRVSHPKAMCLIHCNIPSPKED
jgi:hypothetical protein